MSFPLAAGQVTGLHVHYVVEFKQTADIGEHRLRFLAGCTGRLPGQS